MLHASRIGSLRAALAVFVSGSAGAAEFITQRCTDYRHPETRFEVSDETPVEDAQWLIATLENMVSQGSRFRPGDTIQLGWMTNRLEKASAGRCAFSNRRCGARTRLSGRMASCWVTSSSVARIAMPCVNPSRRRYRPRARFRAPIIGGFLRDRAHRVQAAARSVASAGLLHPTSSTN